MTLKMVAGCALAIGGFCIYSHTKMYAKAVQPTPADVEAAQQKVPFSSLSLCSSHNLCTHYCAACSRQKAL